MKFDRTVVVGDLHGQFEIAKKILDYTKNYYNVVFIGDYLDSFRRSPEDQLATINTVVGGIIQEPDRVVGLLGNHELSYLHDNQACSGWNSATDNYVSHYRDTYLEHLKHWHWINDHFLCTHAGVPLSAIPPYFEGTLKDEVQKYLRDGDIYAVGRARGGKNTQGGIFWQDWNFEFEPIEGLKQIVGHTHGRGIREKDGNYCVDCLEDGYDDVLIVHPDNTVEVLDYHEI